MSGRSFAYRLQGVESVVGLHTTGVGSAAISILDQVLSLGGGVEVVVMEVAIEDPCFDFAIIGEEVTLLEVIDNMAGRIVRVLGEAVLGCDWFEPDSILGVVVNVHQTPGGVETTGHLTHLSPRFLVELLTRVDLKRFTERGILFIRGLVELVSGEVAQVI
jgi:hypothetical protein